MQIIHRKRNKTSQLVLLIGVPCTSWSAPVASNKLVCTFTSSFSHPVLGLPILELQWSFCRWVPNELAARVRHLHVTSAKATCMHSAQTSQKSHAIESVSVHFLLSRAGPFTTHGSRDLFLQYQTVSRNLT